MYLGMNEVCVLTGTDKFVSLCVKKSNLRRFRTNGIAFKKIEIQNQINSNIAIRKCCKDGEVILKKPCFIMGENSTKVFKSKLQTISRSDQYYHEDLKCGPNFAKARIDDFKLISNGSLFWESGDYYVDKNLFCVELYTVDKIKYFLHALVCVSENEITKSYQMPVWGMIISMPFLLLTFLVYLLLPERNLHRRALMSYVFTLLAAYITLVTIQLYSGQFPDTTCHVLGYLIIFFFLVSFFWMNVMCVDMWLAFSGMRTFLSKKTAERKRFIIYCIYAWGMPIVHVLIVFLINHYGSTDTSWNPQIGVKRCFLGEGMPTFYYFYLPMAILIGINITLFVLTTVRIQKIKKETSMLKQTDSRRHTYEDDKQKFNLYLKLMFAMGVNWITELVSWAVDYAFSETPAYVWYITDFTNAMYGVLIFLIFVFKKKIWRSLKKKFTGTYEEDETLKGMSQMKDYTKSVVSSVHARKKSSVNTTSTQS
ncbi:G-protein coupled receptor Mth2-like isoform X2 [Diabrotica virgifera virgifera]|uniref:G-protein coupled receptor Mth2-like n=1 Tax=Diabrotica virgifera virgifera TaxID=50390 RepID=A0ABM5KWU8_DIAVI|nr:G-protein coupled receptor Mth2-like isoform X2 [Diabrotica virgifera virgifera]